MRIDRRTKRQLDAIQTRIKGAGYRRASRKSCRKWERRSPGTNLRFSLIYRDIAETSGKITYDHTIDVREVRSPSEQKRHRMANFRTNSKERHELKKIGQLYHYTGQGVQHITTAGKRVYGEYRFPNYPTTEYPDIVQVATSTSRHQSYTLLPNGTFALVEQTRFREETKLSYVDQKLDDGTTSIRVKERSYVVAEISPTIAIKTDNHKFVSRNMLRNEVFVMGPNGLEYGKRYSVVSEKPFVIGKKYKTKTRIGVCLFTTREVRKLPETDYVKIAKDKNGNEVERYGQKQHRERNNARHTAERKETRLDHPNFGMTYPVGTTLTTDDGLTIPDVNFEQWEMGTEGIKWCTVSPYVIRSIMRGFNSIYWSSAIGNPTKLLSEFSQECLDEICAETYTVIRGLKYWRGKCDGIDTIVLQYARRYGVSDFDKRPDGVIAASRKVNKQGTELDLFRSLGADVQFQNHHERIIFESVISGGWEHAAKVSCLTVQTCRKKMRILAEFNR